MRRANISASAMGLPMYISEQSIPGMLSSEIKRPSREASETGNDEQATTDVQWTQAIPKEAFARIPFLGTRRARFARRALPYGHFASPLFLVVVASLSRAAAIPVAAAWQQGLGARISAAGG